MFLYVVIAILSIIVLMALHELGHFIVARKLNVKVEEFGIGIPPRIFGKKIGETLYSLNLLPIGAFVKIYGEDEKIKDKRSFSEKTIFQRIMILSGGVVAFWIVAFVIFTTIGMIGMPVAIGDDIEASNAVVVIVNINPDSPAEKAGIVIGDSIRKIRSGEEEIIINKAGQVNDFIGNRQAEKAEMVITRNREEINIVVEPSENDMIGVSLLRTEVRKYPFHQSLWLGLTETINKTYLIVLSLKEFISLVFSGAPLLSEGMIGGPVAIVGEVFVGAIMGGLVSYLFMVAVVSIALAVFNLLPIPALDGGRILFLIIEKIKGSPLNPKFEKGVIAISFFLLIGLLIFITIHDIQRLL